MDGIGHPLLRQLYEYWVQKKGARRLPRRGDVDPTELLPLSQDGGTVDKVLSGHVFEFPTADNIQFGSGVDEFREILRLDLPR